MKRVPPISYSEIYSVLVQRKANVAVKIITLIIIIRRRSLFTKGIHISERMDITHKFDQKYAYF